MCVYEVLPPSINFLNSSSVVCCVISGAPMSAIVTSSFSKNSLVNTCDLPFFLSPKVLFCESRPRADNARGR